jgi:predicted amidophosphoribosyltransferase
MTLSKLTHIPLDTNVLRRCKATPSQTTLSANQRQHNLQDAFQINPHHYQHVALLDDVVTTGATAGQLTELLHQSGITTVEVWALCRTLKHPH